jgi:hypothetical protein
MPLPSKPDARQRLMDLLSNDPMAEVDDGTPAPLQAGPDDDWVSIPVEETTVELGGGFDPAIALTRKVIQVEQG